MKEKRTCIICLEEKEGSLEHVFPDALGGVLTFWDVCVDCNSNLGRKVDAPLINNPLMEIFRLAYKLEGKTGKVPNPFKKGFLSDDPDAKVHYKLDDKGNPVGLELLPLKKVEEDEKGVHIHISADIKSKDSVIKMVKSELKKRKLPQMTDEEILGTLKTQKVVDPQITISKEISLDDWKPAILKIVYEIAYLKLGKAYLTDDTAKIIRDVLQQKISPEEALINGVMTLGKLNMLSGLNQIIGSSNSMTVLLFRERNNISAIVNLFNQFTAVFCISKQAEKYNLENYNGVIIVNNIEEKNFEEIDFLEYLNRQS